MKHDQYGRVYGSQADIVELLYRKPDLDISKLFLTDALVYNAAIKTLFADQQPLEQYTPLDISMEEFDSKNQQDWFMPDSYKNLDIANWVLTQCNNDEELQRVAQELLLYQERNLFDLLRFLKYLVDTLRANNLVWGVGRGSSVASYVLYLIGVHKINSIYYDLDVTEFLK